VTANAESDAPPTGIFFSQQNAAELIKAVELYGRIQDRFNPAKIRDHAAQFSTQRFRDQIHEFIRARLGEPWGVTSTC
jgi:hypothetical protein